MKTFVVLTFAGIIVIAESGKKTREKVVKFEQEKPSVYKLTKIDAG